MTFSSPSPCGSAERGAALELLRAGASFLLVGHQRPDGDCIGSQVALSRVLDLLGRRTRILNPDPLERQFDRLRPACGFETWAGGELPAHDVVVLLDCAELSRCGPLGDALAASSSSKLVVDHHIHRGQRWWDAAYVDVTAAATGMLVARIARELEVALDQAAAEGVFTSIVSDTGWFKYANTDAETLRVASEMVSFGVDVAGLYRSLYQRRSRAHPRALGELLARVEYFAGGRLALLCLPRADVDGVAPDGDDALDVLRSVDRVEVVLYLRELKDGRCKLSARSKTAYDVEDLASEFGGGGHLRAAGATIAGALDEVRERLVAAAMGRFGGGAEP